MWQTNFAFVLGYWNQWDEVEYPFWFILVSVVHPKSKLWEKKFHTKVGQQFRMSYESYRKILQEIKIHEFFPWHKNTAISCGCRTSPMELLLLGSLRCLVQGWAFDNLDEATGISNETHDEFLHIFLIWGSSFFFHQQVVLYDDGRMQENCLEY